MSAETTSRSEKAIYFLKQDAEKIIQLIEVQLENLTMPKCPLYEEVVDTQMFGLSREIDFAVRLELIDKQTGQEILSHVEKKLSELYEHRQKKG